EPQFAALANPESTQNWGTADCGKVGTKGKTGWETGWELVRWKGFEPSRYCYRQPLKLVRLPVPPPPQSRCYPNCTTGRLRSRRFLDYSPALARNATQTALCTHTSNRVTASWETAPERPVPDSAAKAQANSAYRPAAFPSELLELPPEPQACWRA